MKTYLILIKQAKVAIELKQKELNQIHLDRTNLEHQIEHLIEMFERERIEASIHKTFFNPKYFDRISNKVKAYQHLLNGKIKEFDMQQNEILELFATKKKYEVLLENWQHEELMQRQKREADQLADLFRFDAGWK